MEKAAKLSPPWVKFYRELEALFEGDPGVRLSFDEDTYEIKIYVEGAIKAEALTTLLPVEKTFGNVTVKVTVIPANLTKDDKLALYKAAFEGNPAFSYATKISGIMVSDMNFVVFQNKVVQFFNDDLGDLNGLCSTLYQEIAKDVFEDQTGVFFCTEVGV